MIGRVFDDRYEVISKLGTGGMAEVYLANDRLLNRQVALKVLSSRYAGDEQFVERFRREASSAASLNHPNIVQIYDRGEAEGTYYIAMEYLEGRSLKEIILKYAPLSPDLLVSISVQILEALRFAHRRDVIHRDIKPQNIIVDNEGRVKVTDFGIARAGSASTMTEAGSILGTAHYLSPEQAQGHTVEAASDLYSLGVVMYEMATGQLPFDGDNPVSIAMQHVHEQPQSPRTLVPGFPANLEAVILRALGKRPTERYLTAQSFLDDLRKVQEGEEVLPPAGFMEQSTRVMAAGAMAGMSEPTTVRRRAVREEPAYASQSYDQPYNDPPRRRSVWPWLLVIILIMALAGGAYAILSTWNGGAKNQVAAPSVLGLTVDAATAKARTEGFSLSNKGTMPSADYAAGQVARQVPDEGTKLGKGDAIQVWLSSGQGQVTVPNLVGMTVEDAAQELGAKSLKVKKADATDATKPAGTVVRQDPAANAQVSAGATITIYVVSATNTVTVPLLTNLSQDTAVANLTALKLVPAIQQTNSTLPLGTVVDQNPKAGQDVPVGSTVTIMVSNNPTPVQVYVPDVTGLSPSKAEAALAQYGLSASVTQQETPDHPAGQIFQQIPGAGVKVNKGSTVEIVVAVTPVTTTTTLPPTTTTTLPPETTTTTGETDTTTF